MNSKWRWQASLLAVLFLFNCSPEKLKLNSAVDWYYQAVHPAKFEPAALGDWQHKAGSEKKPVNFPFFVDELPENGERLQFYKISGSFAWPEKNATHYELFLPRIGEVYQIFLNGTLIADEMPLVAKRPDKLRCHRNRAIKLHRNLVKAGNQLVFVIGGQRSSTFQKNFLFGLTANNGYTFAPAAAVDSARILDTLNLILFGIYGFFGLYHLGFFLNIRKYRHFLYFGLFSIVLSVYLFTLSPFILESIHDTRLPISVAYIAQPVALSFLLKFLAYFLDIKSGKRIRFLFHFLNAVFVGLFFISNYSYQQTILVCWYLVAGPALVYILFLIAFNIGKQPGAGALTIALALAAVCVSWDILDTLTFNTNFRLTSFAYFFITSVLIIVLIREFTDNYSQIENWSLTLEKSIRNRTKELLDASKAAEVANESKSEFLKSVATEIKTPLGIIQGNADILAHEAMSSQSKLHLKSISKASKHMLSIVNDIMHVSELFDGSLPIEKVEFSIHSFVEEVLNAVYSLAIQKSIRIQQSISDEIPPILISDPVRLRQLLYHVLSAVIMKQNSGRVQLYISGRRDHHDDYQILFHLKTAIESMDEEDEGTTQLSIARKIVDMLHGKMHNKEGQGSELYIEIPVELRKETATPFPFRPLRLLSVDDNPDNQRIIQYALKESNIDCAYNGLDAIDLVKSRNYDLILMDLEMPIMDGVTATYRIREWEKDKNKDRIPILAMTAFRPNSKNNKIAGNRDPLEKLFQGWIHKPLSGQILKQELAKYKTER